MKEMNVKKLAEQMSLPVIVAPMFIVSRPEMVLESCKAGVVGTFPTLNARTVEELEEWFQKIKGEIEEGRVANPERKIAPWGVNLIVHASNGRYKSDLELIRQYEPPVVITSLGKPVNEVAVVHEYGGLVFSDVITVAHAKKAAEAGVDGLILVCNGAGGHGGTLNPFAFIAEVRQFWDGIIVLAGCLSSGRDIAAAKLLGADFIYMGTRFIATEEAAAKDGYKEMLVNSTANDIIYTDAISGVRGNYLLPSMMNAGLDPTQLKKKEKIEVAKSDSDAKAWKDIWSAGQGVGSIQDVQSVAAVVRSLKEEYEQAIDELKPKQSI